MYWHSHHNQRDSCRRPSVLSLPLSGRDAARTKPINFPAQHHSNQREPRRFLTKSSLGLQWTNKHKNTDTVQRTRARINKWNWYTGIPNNENIGESDERGDRNVPNVLPIELAITGRVDGAEGVSQALYACSTALHNPFHLKPRGKVGVALAFYSQPYHNF